MSPEKLYLMSLTGTKVHQLQHFNSLKSQLSKFYYCFADTIKNVGITPPAQLNETTIEVTNIMDLVKNNQSLTPAQMKSYITNGVSDLLYKHPEKGYDPSSMTQYQIEQVTQFINAELSKLNTQLDQKYQTLPKDLQSIIDNRLQSFCHLSDNEFIADRVLMMNNKQLGEYWPFTKVLPADNYKIEITAVRNSPLKDPDSFVIDSMINGRYHVVINSPTQMKMTICHQINNGYLVQLIENSLDFSITEYDEVFQKSGCCFFYKGGELRQIHQYQSNLLDGESLYMINHQVALVAPFIKDQPHGTLLIADSSQTIIYGEIFYNGKILLTIPISFLV